MHPLAAGAPSTLDALTAPWSFEEALPERSFLALLRRVANWDAEAVSLDVALALIATLQLDDRALEIGDDEAEALLRSWRASTDAVRIRFVAEVEFDRAPLLLDFLWLQVVPPAFEVNAFRVRRESRASASPVRVAWRTSAPSGASCDRGERPRPSARALATAPDDGIASACRWPPSAAAASLLGEQGGRSCQALELLATCGPSRGRSGTTRPSRGRRPHGIEISLAEVKIAAVAPPRSPRARGLVLDHCSRLLVSARPGSASRRCFRRSRSRPADRRLGSSRQDRGLERRHRSCARGGGARASRPGARFARHAAYWARRPSFALRLRLDLVPPRTASPLALLINFARAASSDEDCEAARLTRVRVTTQELPRCVRESGHAATMSASSAATFPLCATAHAEGGAARDLERLRERAGHRVRPPPAAWAVRAACFARPGGRSTRTGEARDA